MKAFEQQLMERLEAFALQIIRSYSTLPNYPERGHQVSQVLGKQMLRSGTSIGANYAEATRSHRHGSKWHIQLYGVSSGTAKPCRSIHQNCKVRLNHVIV